MSGIDRLAELRGDTEDVVNTNDDHQTSTSSASADVVEHMKLYDPIKRGLDIIKANSAQVEKLKAKNKTTANEKARKDIMNQLDEVMSATNKQGTLIKKSLDSIKAENQGFMSKNKDSAKAQLRNNLYQTHIRRFHQGKKTKQQHTQCGRRE